jgi:hypothetical protein
MVMGTAIQKEREMRRARMARTIRLPACQQKP